MDYNSKMYKLGARAGKRIEALEAENKQLRDQLTLNSQNSSKPPSSDASRKSKSLRKSRSRSRGG